MIPSASSLNFFNSLKQIGRNNLEAYLQAMYDQLILLLKEEVDAIQLPDLLAGGLPNSTSTVSEVNYHSLTDFHFYHVVNGYSGPIDTLVTQSGFMLVLCDREQEASRKVFQLMLSLHNGKFYFRTGLLSVLTSGELPWVDWSAELKGAKGDNGLSAYQVWLAAGNTGTVTQYLNSLIGPQGKSAYQVWLDLGNSGTQAAFIASLTGATGASAYQTWLSLGNSGSQADFINSLVGQQGPNGKDVYELWLEIPGNEDKTFEEFLAEFKGEKGDTASIQTSWVKATLSSATSYPFTTPASAIFVFLNGVIQDTDTYSITFNSEGKISQINFPVPWTGELAVQVWVDILPISPPSVPVKSFYQELDEDSSVQFYLDFSNPANLGKVGNNATNYMTEPQLSVSPVPLGLATFYKTNRALEFPIPPYLLRSGLPGGAKINHSYFGVMNQEGTTVNTHTYLSPVSGGNYEHTFVRIEHQGTGLGRLRFYSNYLADFSIAATFVDSPAFPITPGLHYFAASYAIFGTTADIKLYFDGELVAEQTINPGTMNLARIATAVKSFVTTGSSATSYPLFFLFFDNKLITAAETEVLFNKFKTHHGIE